MKYSDFISWLSFVATSLSFVQVYRIPEPRVVNVEQPAKKKRTYCNNKSCKLFSAGVNSSRIFHRRFGGPFPKGHIEE